MTKKELQAALTAKGLPANGTVKELEARLNGATTGTTFNSNYSVPRIRWESPIIGGSVIKDSDNFDVVTINKVSQLKKSDKTGFYAYELNADGKSITRYLNEAEILELAKRANAYRLNEASDSFDIDTDKLVMTIKDGEVSLAA